MNATKNAAHLKSVTENVDHFKSVTQNVDHLKSVTAKATQMQNFSWYTFFVTACNLTPKF